MTPDEVKETIERLHLNMDQNAEDDLVSKPWWQSRSIWGAVIVVVAQAARLVEVDIPVEAATDTALSIATLVGAGMAWCGRVRATGPINLLRILPGVRLQ